MLTAVAPKAKALCVLTCLPPFPHPFSQCGLDHDLSSPDFITSMLLYEPWGLGPSRASRPSRSSWRPGWTKRAACFSGSFVILRRTGQFEGELFLLSLQTHPAHQSSASFCHIIQGCQSKHFSTKWGMFCKPVRFSIHFIVTTSTSRAWSIPERERVSLLLWTGPRSRAEKTERTIRK